MIRLCIIGLLAVLALPDLSHAAGDSVNLQATLVLASQDKGQPDPRLKGIEGRLRKLNFKFASYRHYGSGNAATGLPGTASINLGQGFKLDVKASPAGKGNIRSEVKWFRGKQMLISTTVVTKPGVPSILGGPSHEGGNLIVVLTAK